jgi:hypothetical protein
MSLYKWKSRTFRFLSLNVKIFKVLTYDTYDKHDKYDKHDAEDWNFRKKRRLKQCEGDLIMWNS